MKRRYPAVNRNNLTAQIQATIDQHQTALVEMGYSRYPTATCPSLGDTHNDPRRVVGASVVMQIQALIALAETFRIYPRLEAA